MGKFVYLIVCLFDGLFRTVGCGAYGLSATTFDTLRLFDSRLLLSMNGSDSLYLDGVMWAITRTATWIPMMLALAYIILKNNKLWRALLTIFFVAALILVCDQFASAFCKPHFQRLRPTHDPLIWDLVDTVHGYRGGDYGFISSHAANTFGAATFVALLLRRWSSTFVLYVWAVLCSYSRIYLGVHFPFDILCGALFGILCGLFFYWLFRFTLRKVSDPYELSSTAYTPTGYQKPDISFFNMVFVFTLAYISIRAIFYAITL